MSLVSYDRVRETTTVLGTNDATLLGAVTGFQSFAVVGSGNTCYYTIADQAGNWEVGLGTYSSVGPTLARTTILASSNSNTIVSFPAGTKDIFLTYVAEKAVQLDASGNLNLEDGKQFRLHDDAGTEYVGIKSPATLGATYVLTLPVDDGTNGQALITDGAGNLSWSTAASGDVYGPASSTDTAVALFDGTTGKLLKNSVVTIDGSGNVSGLGTVNATTLDLTNLEVTNIKAKDGTAAITLANSTGAITLNGGTANGVAYLNGSKVLTTGSALTFDGTNFATTGTTSATKLIPTGGTATGNGMYLPAANTLAWSNNGSETMRLDSSGNLGLGVTPSAWVGTVKALQFGANGSMWGSTSAGNNATFGSNIYFDSSSIATYITNGYSTRYQQFDGSHRWYTAPSGTAGNAISFTQAMTLDASGQLGIGTTSPSNSTLDVVGNINSIAARFRGRSSDNTATVIFDNNSGNAGTQVNYIQSITNSNLSFATNNTERMRIDSSGNVGIGTSSITEILTLNASTNTTTAIRLKNQGTSVGFISNGAAFAGTGSSNDFVVSGLAAGTNTIFGSAGYERMRIDSSGNVGIGTSSPLRKLDVQSAISATYSTANDVQVLINATATTAGISSTYGSTGSYVPLTFSTNGSERARIDTSGAVGIGTSTTLAQKLTVVGSTTTAIDSYGQLSVLTTDSVAADKGGQIMMGAYYTGTSFAALGGIAAKKENATSGNYAGYLQFITSSYPAGNVERMRIDSSGQLLVGLTSGVTTSTVQSYQTTSGQWAYTAKSTANAGSTYFHNFLTSDNTQRGYIYFNGSQTVYSTSSDERLKENIVDAPSSLDEIEAINIRSFDWKESKVHQKYGVIAQEIQNIAPDVVSTPPDKDGMLGVDYSLFVPRLIKAIQELKAELDATKAEVAALKGA